MSSVAVALACCRLLHDAAIIGLWGGFGYLATLVPAALARDIEPRLGGLRLSAIGLALLTTLMRLPLESAMIGSGWADALNPAVLWPVLATTSVGTGWQVEAATALLLLATLLTPPRHIAVATAAAAGLMLVALAFSGHAMMRADGPGLAQRFNDALHVLAGGAWLGALVPLLAVLDRLGHRACGGDAEVALRRFSVAGHLAVALTVATGIVNTWLIVGGLPFDWTVPYQALLSVKIALVAVLITLASLNRYRYAPQLGGDPNASTALRRGTIGEIAVGLGVIALVAVFGLMDPM